MTSVIVSYLSRMLGPNISNNFIYLESRYSLSKSGTFFVGFYFWDYFSHIKHSTEHSLIATEINDQYLPLPQVHHNITFFHYYKGVEGEEAWQDEDRCWGLF